MSDWLTEPSPVTGPLSGGQETKQFSLAQDGWDVGFQFLARRRGLVRDQDPANPNCGAECKGAGRGMDGEPQLRWRWQWRLPKQLRWRPKARYRYLGWSGQRALSLASAVRCEGEGGRRRLAGGGLWAREGLVMPMVGTPGCKGRYGGGCPATDPGGLGPRGRLLVVVVRRPGWPRRRRPGSSLSSCC